MIRNKKKELDPIEAGHRLYLKNEALGCLAVLGGFIFRFVVFVAFAAGLVWFINH